MTTPDGPKPYSPPVIEARDDIFALLSGPPGPLGSDAPVNTTTVNVSDVNVKRNIRPVRW